MAPLTCWLDIGTPMSPLSKAFSLVAPWDILDAIRGPVEKCWFRQTVFQKGMALHTVSLPQSPVQLRDTRLAAAGILAGWLCRHYPGCWDFSSKNYNANLACANPRIQSPAPQCQAQKLPRMETKKVPTPCRLS